jgi:hypothetical protein
MAVSVPWHRSAADARSRPGERATVRARKDWRAKLFSRAVLGVVIALAAAGPRSDRGVHLQEVL